MSLEEMKEHLEWLRNEWAHERSAGYVLAAAKTRESIDYYETRLRQDFPCPHCGGTGTL